MSRIRIGRRIWLGGVLLLCLFCGTRAVEAQHDIGAGFHYWKVIDDIDVTNIDDSGFSYYVNYRYAFRAPLRVELILERLPDRFGKDAYAPQGYLIVGNRIYAGAGVGGVYTDGSFSDEPFYALKAGVSLPLPLWLLLDISAQYRFNDFADLRDEDRKIGTDTVFLGAALRLTL